MGGFNTDYRADAGDFLQSEDPDVALKALQILQIHCEAGGNRATQEAMRDWEIIGRKKQKPPERHFQWRLNQYAPIMGLLFWIVCAGRGWGKTRVGSQMSWSMRRLGLTRLAGIGMTARDCRFVMVTGKSGILSPDVADAWDLPVYSPGNRTVIWSEHGHLPECIMTLSSAAKPEQVRGDGIDWAWMDEVAAFRNLEQFLFTDFLPSLRNQAPRHLPSYEPWVLGTSTPLPTKDFSKLYSGPDSYVTTGATRENVDHLNAMAVGTMERVLKGARADQELLGKLLDGTEGALWDMTEDIDAHRLRWMRPTDDNNDEHDIPQWCYKCKPDKWVAFGRNVKMVLGVDPAKTKKETSDMCGLVLGAVNNKGHVAVIADFSDRLATRDVLDTILKICKDYGVSTVAVEANAAGDWVTDPLKRELPRSVNVVSITVSVGKMSRAMEAHRLYREEIVHHLDLMVLNDVSPILDMYGRNQAMGGGPVPVQPLGDTEEQMTTWDGTGPSPDRIDALVFMIMEAIKLHRKPGKPEDRIKVELPIKIPGQTSLSRQRRERQSRLLGPIRRRPRS